ncbi:uncharacterized protein LOC120358894 [Solenopsis invicta]|uniref:uncharacterized protein LOC120358894 n=1 Tax=Solenopsis invicta TaxID=13686 RepID=UPI00193E8740|nr:uncharacterized protein LOC120358894 [Solenopsis invicta]XP_039310566.1 uncharacterized protein LOC120358894 [Solenopsis invicta]
MKDLVSTRKIKTYKILWKHIAQKMNLNDYLVTSLQVENKIKSFERSYKNMISNNKMTGRARKTCQYKAELTDLLGEKHSIQPLAISGRNGLILKEQLHSNKENNTAMNNATDNEDYENNPGVSNNLESAENVQTVRTEELQTHQTRSRQNTTSLYINKCQAVLDTYISERSNEKQRNKNIQIQILQEFKNIAKTQEDFVNSAKIQWAISNAKKDENIKVLKEIAKNIEQIVTFPFRTTV